MRTAADFLGGDGHGRHPRFAADNIARNLAKVAALDVVLSAAEVAQLSAALPPGAAAGTRYPAAMKAIYL